jgi:hypothetical protein
MRALSKREARLIALGILVAALVLADLVLVQPLADGFARRADARAQLATRYVANARLIGAVPRLVREAARRDAALGRFVAPERNAGAASDMLRQRVQSATSAVGGDFRGSEDSAGPPGTAVIRASLRLTAEQLDRLIALIENGRPLITISALSVGADDALVTGRATDLDVQIECSLAYRAAPKR